ncbi:MAG: LuxR C-terminal-related transcriptional regulator [Lachnospiraceae bacterium]|nr:LuxR C-terminal-related transcriptional regulator [Lachnospiraceae bacterium]
MSYIKVPKVYKKLKKAEDSFLPVIMTAPTGWGKSAAIEYYYRRKSTLTLYCKDGKILDKPDIKDIRRTVVIIEDVHLLCGGEDFGYLRKLLKEVGIQVIVITRGSFPKCLSSEEQDCNFIRIVESDFVMGEKEVEKFFEDREVSINPEDVPLVTKASMGYPRAVYYYTVHMANGVRYSQKVYQKVLEDIYHLWDGMVFDSWPDNLQRFVLSVSQYEDFTEDMAGVLSGNLNISEVLECCRNTTSMVDRLPNGNYTFREELRGFFQWKQAMSWPREAIEENYRIGAYYYEMHGDIPKALKYYDKGKDKPNIMKLLIKNAQLHPGTGHYIETKDYYLEIPEEEAKKNTTLMAGLSMLYALILEPDKSERWYHELELVEKDKDKPKEVRKDARMRLSYLDISLPQRGVKGILRIMKNVFSLIRKGDVTLPEMSVTGNMPSLMNGGLDFSEWSKSDTQIARFMAKPIEVIVGNYGNGLVTIALAESGFEKASMRPYEVLTRLTAGYEAAAHGGKVEMCFSAAGVQARQHIVEGQYPSAKRIRDTIHRLVYEREADNLYSNLEAFEAWLSLYTGSGNEVRSYIEKTDSIMDSFTILDRYRCMIRIRCLISENKLMEAMSLASYLTVYFERYERYFYWMENEILKGVILYRLGDKHWEKHIMAAVKKAEEYHFVRIISMEGEAVLPLLKELEEKNAFKDIDEDYYQQVIMETEKVAHTYPDYMKFIPKEEISLTKRESEILSLLCGGYTTEEILKTLGITANGLKKHNYNLYKKLGVNNRAEAERKAAKLGLVVRK